MSTQHRSAATARLSHQDLLEAFEGPIEPVPTSVLYLFGLLVVSAAMILLPLVYLGALAAVGYGLYYHVTENIAHASRFGGVGSTRAQFMVYVAPLVVGVVALLFMLKPLFSRYPRDERRISLVPKGEPLLYEFIAVLCRHIHAPIPRRIDVDLSSNAAAGFRRGMLSFLGNDLVLTIGLPLAATMDVRELTGIMAHEFGHFTQGLAMRLTYLIRSINDWFGRVVYERDNWDTMLANSTREGGSYMAIIAYLAMLFVWLTRRLLWCLMMAGHAISCFMLRQMEFDADRHQARVSGGEAFASAFRKLLVLEAAEAKANAEMNQMLHDRKLPDNFPLFVHTAIDRLPESLRRSIEEGLRKTDTGALDTHPAVGVRIERARAEDTSGIFQKEAPASVLFSNFDWLCREVTRTGYDRVLGNGFARVQLVPVAVAKIQQQAVEEGYGALDRYYQRIWTLDRPLGLKPGEFEPVPEASAAIDRLRRTRKKIEDALPQARRLMRKYREACGEAEQCGRVRALMAIGIKLDTQNLKLLEGAAHNSHGGVTGGGQLLDKCREKLALLDAAQRKRLLTALSLLKFDQVAGKVEGAQRMRRQSEKQLQALYRLEAVMDAIGDLRKSCQAISTMIEVLQQDDRNERAMRKLGELVPAVHEGLSGLRSSLDTDPYPFEHPEEGISIGDWAVQVPPFRDDLAKIMGSASGALDRLNSLYLRLVSALVTAAETVESAVGLEPLPVPSKDDDKTED